LEKLRLDRVFVFVNISSPLKPWASEFQDRHRMAELHFQKMDRVTVGRSLTQSEIVPYLKHEFPEASLYQLMGEDSLNRLPASVQKDPAQKAQIVLFPRESLHLEMAESIQVMPRVHATSSTLLRRQIASGEKPNEICKEVWKYIEDLQLYKTLHSPQRS
jgi:nicotinic acid mononucleotide adenylyltransferase